MAQLPSGLVRGLRHHSAAVERGLPFASLGINQRLAPLAVDLDAAADICQRSRSTGTSCSTAAFAAVTVGSTVACASRARRQSNRGSRKWRTVVAVGDETGAWERIISRIGPPVSQDELAKTAAEEGDCLARWRLGVGSLRVAFHEDDIITAISCHQGTMCIGTQSGLIRTIDTESGGVVGDYYIGKHCPPSAITALHFDGHAVVAGNALGHVFVWRAELPGHWGFHHSPQWALGTTDSQHQDPITAIVLSAAGLISSDACGRIVFWQALGNETEVAPREVMDLQDACHCMSIDPETNNVYCGTDAGLLQFSVSDEKSEWVAFPDEKHRAVTALAWNATTNSLLIGCQEWSDPLEYADDVHEQVAEMLGRRPWPTDKVLTASGAEMAYKDVNTTIQMPNFMSGGKQLNDVYPIRVPQGSIFRLTNGEFAESAFDNNGFLNANFGVQSLHTSPAGFVVSTSADGPPVQTRGIDRPSARIVVWDEATGKPIWGLQGSYSDPSGQGSLCSDRAVAVCDGSRLLVSGFVIAQPMWTHWRFPSRDWREPSLGHFSHKEQVWQTPCEGVVCMDFGDDRGRSDASTVPLAAEAMM